MQTDTIKGSFDSGHRLLEHKGQCRNVHGHTYLYEVTFQFEESAVQRIGFPVDFADLKPLVKQTIDLFDHAFICNPQDTEVIDFLRKDKTKFYVMTIDGNRFCNPSAENIGVEMMLHLRASVAERYDTAIVPVQLRLYETPNSFCDTNYHSPSPARIDNWFDFWRNGKGKGIGLISFLKFLGLA